MKTIEMLINEIKANETMKKQLIEAVKNNTVAAFLADQSCEATTEEFIAELKAPISDDDLDAVAGGANAEETIVSIFTLGICCIVEYVNSTNSDVPKEEWGDGRILCTPATV